MSRSLAPSPIATVCETGTPARLGEPFECVGLPASVHDRAYEAVR